MNAKLVLKERVFAVNSGGHEVFMSEGIEKLHRDVEILAAMASEMEDYLRSDVLFWRIMDASMPRLTLGGYLMRQHRLLALEHLLDEATRQVMETAVTQYNLALVEKIVRLEQKIQHELEARLRQWSEYLRDLTKDKGASNYAAMVETRAMIDALVGQLELPPYQLDVRVPQQIALLDNNLRRHLRRGAFVWPVEWQPAYPESVYWWLYGEPG